MMKKLLRAKYVILYYLITVLRLVVAMETKYIRNCFGSASDLFEHADTFILMNMTFE